MSRTCLSSDFFARDATVVAYQLLGCILVHHNGDTMCASNIVAGRIVETEAYLGPHDLACHSSKGKTKRTKVMFGPPAHAYVYLIYGMHELFNVVTGNHNGQAVLIRALEPLENITGKTDGPGKLTKAMGITRAYNATPLTQPPLYFSPAEHPASNIQRTARINVDYAGEWAKAPLRFVDADSAFLSKKIC